MAILDKLGSFLFKHLHLVTLSMITNLDHLHLTFVRIFERKIFSAIVIQTSVKSDDCALEHLGLCT